MNEVSDARCPHHARAGGASPPAHPAGHWPPGPPSGLTGWGLLVRMARDLTGALQDWQGTYGDVVHLRIWPEHEVIVADPALARELLVDHHDALVRWERGIAVFRRVEGDSIFVSEGESWRRQRQALQPAFHLRCVQAFVPTIASATDAMLARWPGDAADWPVEPAFTSLATDVIVRLLFTDGLREADRGIGQAVRDVLVATNAEMFWPVSAPDWMPWKGRKRRALARLRGFIDAHVRARLGMPRERWPDDLLGRLLRLHATQPDAWPLRAVHDECMTTFLAGHETTAAALAWWAWDMASHPAAQQQARAEVQTVLRARPPEAHELGELGYLAATLRESLRLHPPAPILFTRRSTAPIRLGPWQFPARTMFLVPVQAMQRDARSFPEPAAFRPERFLGDVAVHPRGAWLPFGTGPRVCLGQHLAMTELTVIAAMVLQRFRLTPQPGRPEPRAVLHISLRPEQPLVLRVEPVAAGG